MTIKTTTTLTDWQACFPVVHELRPHLSQEQYLAQVQRQYHQGYQLLFLEEEGKVHAILGYRFTECLAWGASMYIDDLATLSTSRGKGYGKAIMEHALQLARAHHCQQVHLDTGWHRHDAHRLYLNMGFRFNCHHLALDL